MDIKLARQLAELMEEYKLTHAELSEGESRIFLGREPSLAAQGVIGGAEGSTTIVTAEPSPAAPAVEGEALTSPLVGCVYLAPGPEAENFVAVGSRVKAGQVLCIVEAMKVMNEFTSPRDGEIAEICVANEEMVEFGQMLFRLK